MKLSRKWLLIASLVLSVAMATGGTLAYLTDTESDHNVMTVGSVDIEQLEYERIVNENGDWVPAEPKYAFESADHQIYKPDAMQEFTQGKWHQTPEYRLFNHSGPQHAPLFEVEVKAANYCTIGAGTSRKLAETDAAAKMLKFFMKKFKA